LFGQKEKSKSFSLLRIDVQIRFKLVDGIGIGIGGRDESLQYKKWNQDNGNTHHPMSAGAGPLLAQTARELGERVAVVSV